MRAARIAYLLPLTLLSVYLLLALGLRVLSDCPPGQAPYAQCLVAGVDMAGVVNAGGRIGTVFVPIALGWLALGALAYGLSRHLRNRS
ncbi:MAG: hypothetical protein JXJ18_09005 [Rhodobacteraceae bacterium]|nr:hypothetical protein [Paracoccaceae bacterium]